MAVPNNDLELDWLMHDFWRDGRSGISFLTTGGSDWQAVTFLQLDIVVRDGERGTRLVRLGRVLC